MGIQINGQTDTITATDGSLSIQGASGNLTGDLTGNVTGNVTGNLTGTASTATAAATAYGLSGSPTLSGITSVSTTNLTVNGNSYPSAGPLSNRNKIINGDMRIDQRNAGASVTPTDAYTLDRWEIREDTDGAVTAQQVSEAPAGFNKSLKITVTTADSSLAATQRLLVDQRIEGFNTADLDFGTAGAKTVTLSFWVRSSLTGTFGGSLINHTNNRSYPYTYSISAANTWEYKTVTIAGDTSGTWETTTSAGIKVYFGLGVGSTYSGTASAWAASEFYSTTGAVSVIGTLNATWQITGVQLEVGSVATPFEHRSYGDELARCERYYQVIKAIQAMSGGASTIVTSSINLRTVMRSTPTWEQTGAFTFERSFYGGTTQTSASVTVYSAGSNTPYGSYLKFNNIPPTLPDNVGYYLNDSTDYLTASAEL